MKNLLDIAQILLTLPGFAFAGCLALVIITSQAFRIGAGLASWIFGLVSKYGIPIFSLRFWLISGLISGILCLFADRIASQIETIEQRFFDPVYSGQFANMPDPILLDIYEAEILRKVKDPHILEIVRRHTYATAEALGASPVSIYEMAYLECGLDPFRIRNDRIAAGWIQFTKIGLSSLGASLEQVIALCEQGDQEAARQIMDLSDRYLRAKVKKHGSFDQPIDVYLAVFAPGKIGFYPTSVVYAGINNPAYYKNAGLDGWVIENGKIIRLRSRIDGKITVGEIKLCLERKKGILIKEYFKR